MCLVFPSVSPYYNLSSSLQVKVKASSVVQASKLTVSIQPPLAVTQDQFVLEPMGECIAPFLSFVYNLPFFVFISNRVTTAQTVPQMFCITFQRLCPTPLCSPLI